MVKMYRRIGCGVILEVDIDPNKTFFFPDSKDKDMVEYEQRECVKDGCGRPFMANIEKNETVCPKCVEIANLEDNGC